MNTFEAIQTRRAVKHFDPSHKMPAAEERKLLEAAILSPTAFNIQHWRLVVLRDPALRQAVRQVAWDQAQVTEASLVIVICADLKAWEKSPERYWRNAPKEVQDFVLPGIDQYYRDRPQVERDEGMRSAGIVVQSIMLAAKSMGYESCPMDGFDFDGVGKMINLPKDHAIAMMLAVGKGTVEAKPRAGQLPYAEVVIDNTF